jgi:hypothetical protein
MPTSRKSTTSGLLAFSIAFQEQLEIVEQSFEKRRTVIDGLEVTVEAIRKEDGFWLRLKSILFPEGSLQAILSASCR